MQDSESQADHLQILASGSRGDVSGLGPHIVDDALLQPGNQEMCSFIHNLLLDTGQSIEDDSPSSPLHIVNGGLGERSSHGEGDGVLVQRLECLSHLDG